MMILKQLSRLRKIGKTNFLSGLISPFFPKIITFSDEFTIESSLFFVTTQYF
jgi:hypothetical protein